MKNHRLQNGLEFVHYPLTQTRFVDLALAVGVGSRHEPTRLAGLTHFMEHMLFRGCEKLPTSFELNREFDRISDGLNAMTYKEFTLFTVRTPKEHVPRVLELLRDVLSAPLFKDLKTERGIILEEILEELDEKGRDTDIENISRKIIFGSHALGRPLLGRPASVKRVTADELAAFHARHYHPSNMVLAVAGGMDWKEAKRAVESAFEAWPEREGAGASAAVESIERMRAGVHIVNDKGSQVEVLISFFVPGEQSPGELARLFLARVLDDGISSRLQRTVCERRGLLYDISCGIEALTDVGLFDIQFSVSGEKLVEVVELVLGELKALKATVIPSDEFELVRERFTRDVHDTAESSKSMAQVMAEAFLLKLPMPILPEEYEARLRELTPDDIRAEATNAFERTKCALVARGRVSPAQASQLKKLVSAI